MQMDHGCLLLIVSLAPIIIYKKLIKLVNSMTKVKRTNTKTPVGFFRDADITFSHIHDLNNNAI